MKFFQRFLMCFFLFSVFVGSAFAQPVVKPSFIIPSDQPVVFHHEVEAIREDIIEVQEFYASEMQRLGYGQKTFEFDTDIPLYLGTQKADAYRDPAQVKALNIPTDNADDIRLVFIVGVSALDINRPNPAAGVYEGTCIRDECDKYGLISIAYKDSEKLRKIIIAHELGHAFGFPGHQAKFGTMMYASAHGTGNLDDIEIHPETAKVIDKSNVLYLQDGIVPEEPPDPATPNNDSVDVNKEYIALAFEYKSKNTLTPTNPSFEWDGWAVGIWEKYVDETITTKPLGYYDFEEMHNLSHWMYSHAPSKIVYDISDEKYTSFSCYLLVPDHPDPTCSPSMEFVVLADDVEIYKKSFSPSNSGTFLAFDIPSETKKFTINIGDLGNNGCDHYILGEPKLYYDKRNGSLSEGINADVNDDGYVDLYDVLIVRSGMLAEVSYDTDVNNDGVTDEVDLLIVKAKAMEAIAAAAPRKRKVNITTWGRLKRQ